MIAMVTAVSTPLRLMDAAEELIAEHGIDVSIRAINARAGASAASTHYHFGSKEDLVRAVLHRRMAALAAERRALLDPIVDDARPPMRVVVTALVAPLHRLALRGHPYVRFLAALRRAGGPWRSMLTAAGQVDGRQWDALFLRALPDLPPAARGARRAALGIVVFEILTEPPVDLDVLVDLLVGMLEAPAT
jgi:AcrR family transcriptional regulator